MAVLIREPPRQDGPARRVSLRASIDELDVSAIARKSGRRRPPPGRRLLERGLDRGDHGLRAPGVPCLLARLIRPASSSSTSRRGRTSFAIVADLRRKTGARTGHAGTLDPFATGLLLLLSGSATKLASCFVGLDKRYVTDIDLTARTSTGDPEGEVVEQQEAPDQEELGRRLAGLRGEVELPIPAASAVKIGGERAYKLARRGVEVEMPLRRSRVDALDVIAYTGEEVRLDLRVSSGTYVRAIADALGGHCRTLRRLEIGPVLGRRSGPRPVHSGRRGAGPAVKVAQRPEELAADRMRRRRSAASTACILAIGACWRLPAPPGGRSTVVTFWPHPRLVLGNQRGAALDARTAPRAARGGRRRRGARRRVHSGARGARAGGVLPTSILRQDRRRGDRGRRELPLRPRRGR